MRQMVTGFIEGMEQRDLPLHVFHFDCFWMREFEWTNFEWDSTSCFPIRPACSDDSTTRAASRFAYG